jgi:hypothetical protein
MARESALRSRFMKMLKDAGFFAQAIESSTNPGMPDVWHIVDGVSGWVECKMVKVLPARAETSLFKSLNHPLSCEQENWIAMCRTKLANCAILVAYERRYFLVPGKHAEVFNTFSMKRLTDFEVSRDQLIEKLRYQNEEQLHDNN